MELIGKKKIGQVMKEVVLGNKRGVASGGRVG